MEPLSSFHPSLGLSLGLDVLLILVIIALPASSACLVYFPNNSSSAPKIASRATKTCTYSISEIGFPWTYSHHC